MPLSPDPRPALYNAWRHERIRQQFLQRQSLITRYDIDCDLAGNAIYAALKARHLRDFRAEREHMHSAYGYQALHWLSREQLYERVRSPAYPGGLLDSESWHLHPLNYTLGLARAAQKAGALLFEDSPVLGIRHGARPEVHTANGALNADFILLAGNAYLAADVVPELAGQLMPVGNYILATEPLSEAQVAATLPYDDAVSNANLYWIIFDLQAVPPIIPRTARPADACSTAARSPTASARRAAWRIECATGWAGCFRLCRVLASIISGQVIHECHYLNGDPVLISPRHVLRRVLALYEEIGIQPVVAPEMEFYFVQRNTNSDYPLQPPAGRSGRREISRRTYSIDAVNEFDPVFEDMYAYCEAEKLDIDTLTHEEGSG